MAIDKTHQLPFKLLCEEKPRIMLTTPNSYDTLLDSDRGTDFLLSNNRRKVGLRNICFSIANRNAPFYLEDIVPRIYKRGSEYPSHCGFQKGHPSFLTEESKKKISLKIKELVKNNLHHRLECKCFRCSKIPWNKGLTKEIDKRVRAAWNKGIPWSKEIKKKLRRANLGKVSWRKGKKFPQFSGENSCHWKGGKLKKFCLICNKEFKIDPSENKKYCSGKCYYIYLASGVLKGEKSLRWRGGITPLTKIIRHLEENRRWIKSVFERDNYVCRECGEARSGNFNAHHIKPFSCLFQEFLQQYNQFSPIEDKETLTKLAITYEPFWDINNGITLCEKCHNRIKRFWGNKYVNLKDKKGCLYEGDPKDLEITPIPKEEDENS